MNPALPRALIVEDDPSWQQILAEILADSGFVVDQASNLAEALQVLKETPHRLAVVDLSLSGLDHSNDDGLRVLTALRRHDPACRAVLLTGFATVELAVSALTEYGAFNFLRKENFQRAQFRNLINRILTSAPYLEPELQTVDSSPLEVHEPAPAAPARANTALVVDDDAGWRSILSELLTDAGFEVRLCNSYGEAMGCLRREKYALAVVDLSLTGAVNNWTASSADNVLEGYQLLSATKASGLPTIVVSGVVSVDEIQRAYTEQAIFAYLEKQTFDRAAFRRALDQARAASPAMNELAVLTEREREVLVLLAGGMTNKEIAERLVVTTNTIKRHLKAIFEKLGVHTRSAAAGKALGAGIVIERSTVVIQEEEE
jgi:DNA-binding NarL/FixJ family response regulator